MLPELMKKSAEIWLRVVVSVHKWDNRRKAVADACHEDLQSEPLLLVDA